MEIIIKCDCGNKITIPAYPRKYTQFTDHLATQQFYLTKTVIKNNDIKEFQIICNKCKTWICLGVD